MNSDSVKTLDSVLSNLQKHYGRGDESGAVLVTVYLVLLGSLIHDILIGLPDPSKITEKEKAAMLMREASQILMSMITTFQRYNAFLGMMEKGEVKLDDITDERCGCIICGTLRDLSKNDGFKAIVTKIVLTEELLRKKGLEN